MKRKRFTEEMGLSNRNGDFKYLARLKTRVPGAGLSSRSTSVAA